jgi:hypothetical protein
MDMKIPNEDPQSWSSTMMLPGGFCQRSKPARPCRRLIKLKGAKNAGRKEKGRKIKAFARTIKLKPHPRPANHHNHESKGESRNNAIHAHRSNAVVYSLISGRKSHLTSTSRGAMEGADRREDQDERANGKRRAVNASYSCAAAGTGTTSLFYFPQRQPLRCVALVRRWSGGRGLTRLRLGGCQAGRG